MKPQIIFKLYVINLIINKQKASTIKKKHMQKNMTFKIHKPRISLALRPKSDKESLITIKKEEEKSMIPEKSQTSIKDITSAQKMKRSKSMLFRSNSKQNQNTSLKTMAFKVNKNQKIITPTLMRECAEHQAEYVTKNQDLQQMLVALIEILSKKQSKFQPLKSSFLIEKNYFINIISYLFALLRSNNHLQCHSEYKQLSQIKDIYTLLFKQQQERAKEQRKCRLELKSQAFTIFSLQRDTQKKYELLINKNQEEISTQNARMEYLGKTCQAFGHEIKEKSEFLTQISIRVEELKTREVQLFDIVQILEQRLSNARQEQKNIFQYINNQRNQCVKTAGEDYKRIEADIYEYASYLQSNVLASDLTYQPHPYQQIQALFKAEFHEIQAKKENQGQGPSKSKEMSQFVRKLLNYIDKKDGQINKLLQFKTKSIKKFISHMKKWLDNWSLKQQYLGNLRKQFAYNTCILQELFETIKCEDDSVQSMDKLRQNVNRLETLYKLGNSFY